jgi:uncharacterized membrane protein YccC
MAGQDHPGRCIVPSPASPHQICGDAPSVLHFPFAQAQIRRAALFLVTIGVPIIVGAIRGEPRAALLGAITGMMMSFADNDGPLPGRLRLLLAVAAAMAAGAAAGHWLRDLPLVLWPAFMAITFAVGLAAGAGREPLLTSRDGAVAFAVAAGIPMIEIHEIWYVAGALVLNAAARSIDHLLAGPLPLAAAGLRPQMPPGRAGWLRFALAYAAAATASLWIGLWLDPIHTIWIVTTTLLVMQPDARASFRRILERIGGTIAGIAAAWAITRVTHSPIAICAAIIVVAPLIPHHLAHRYWLHTALIALMILLAYDLVVLNAGGIAGLLGERLQDMLIGCALAAAGTAAAFAGPRPLRPAAGDDLESMPVLKDEQQENDGGQKRRQALPE